MDTIEYKKSVMKINFRKMMEFEEIGKIPFDFFLALLSKAEVLNGNMYFYNNQTVRRELGDYCNVGDNMVFKNIRSAVDAKLLIPTEDRGVYLFNSKMVSR